MTARLMNKIERVTLKPKRLPTLPDDVVEPAPYNKFDVHQIAAIIRHNPDSTYAAAEALINTFNNGETFKILAHRETVGVYPVSLLKFLHGIEYDSKMLNKEFTSRKEQKEYCNELSEFFGFPIETQKGK